MYSLKEAAESSRYRMLLDLVMDLDFRSTNHYQIDWNEVPADEYLAHKILIEERQRKQREDQEKEKLNLPRG